jgi:hypothetical protein
MGKFGKIFNEANQPEVIEAINAEKTETAELKKLVNLGVKIPAAHRNYWNGKAKSKGLSMKSIITSALIEKLGKPE